MDKVSRDLLGGSSTTGRMTLRFVDNMDLDDILTVDLDLCSDQWEGLLRLETETTNERPVFVSPCGRY